MQFLPKNALYENLYFRKSNFTKLAQQHLVIEKTADRLSKQWNSYVYHALYDALSGEYSFVSIVVQDINFVWTYRVKDSFIWRHRDVFLSSSIENEKDESVRILFENNLIGNHISKSKTLYETFVDKDPKVPYQIFLTTRSSNISVSDVDITNVAQLVHDRRYKIFIHSPYTINLCAEPGSWIVDCLVSHLNIAHRCGFLGVVVHVGKLVGRESAVGLANMRTNILATLSRYEGPTCPLLLETPAGQGTETLTSFNEFFDFVQLIKSESFGVCVDTCHVFAAGTSPLAYLENFQDQIGLVKLIHFNDSAQDLNCCVDRHERIGKGYIPMNDFLSIAYLANLNDIPLIIE